MAATPAVGDMLELYRGGEDLSLAEALAAEAAFSVGRSYDLAAFTEAGRAASARQRGDGDGDGPPVVTTSPRTTNHDHHGGLDRTEGTIPMDMNATATGEAPTSLDSCEDRP